MFGLHPAPGDPQANAIQATAWGDWGDGSLYANTWSGSQVTNMSALQLLAVYGCVRFIVEGISTLPIDVFRELPDGKRVEAPKPQWLLQPTVDLDTIAWLTQLLTSLLLDGNCYCRKVYQQGQLTDLIPFDPASMKVTREAGRKTYRVLGKPIDGNEILHIPGLMYPGQDVGLSPVEAARQGIGTGLATEEFAGRFFGQGANLSGVIEDPGAVDPKKAKDMARIWGRLHSGNRKAHLPGVLQGGASWKPTGVTNEQAQFLQSRGFTAAQIASHMFLIDPSEFGFQPERGSAITYGNLEQRNARKVQVTYLPWIIRLELALSALLPQPRFLKFNANGLLRGDTLTRHQTYALDMQINTQAAALGMEPILATAEMRGFENLPPWEGDIPVPIAISPEVPLAAQEPPTTVNIDMKDAVRVEQPPINVTVNTPETTVNLPATNVHVDAPQVTVQPPTITVQNSVEPTPITVEAPKITVAAPVTVEPPRARSRRIERNEAGDIVRVVEED